MDPVTCWQTSFAFSLSSDSFHGPIFIQNQRIASHTGRMGPRDTMGWRCHQLAGRPCSASQGPVRILVFQASDSLCSLLGATGQSCPL